MQLKEIMTPAVDSISVGRSVSEAAQIMRRLDVGFLPVLDQHIVGVITDRDIVVRCLAEGKDARETPVEAVMTREVEMLPEHADVEDAADLMEKQQIRRVLVTGTNGGCIGIVSLGDLAVKNPDTALTGTVTAKISQPAH